MRKCQEGERLSGCQVWEREGCGSERRLGVLDDETLCVPADILAATLCGPYVRCYLWGDQVEGTRDASAILTTVCKSTIISKLKLNYKSMNSSQGGSSAGPLQHPSLRGPGSCAQTSHPLTLSICILNEPYLFRPPWSLCTPLLLLSMRLLLLPSSSPWAYHPRVSQPGFLELPPPRGPSDEPTIPSLCPPRAPVHSPGTSTGARVHRGHGGALAVWHTHHPHGKAFTFCLFYPRDTHRQPGL